MFIYSNNNKNIVKKVNPYLINKQEDTVIPWQEQLKLYQKGIIPEDLPLVVSPTMNSSNIEGLSAKPVFVYFDTIEKKQFKHDLSDDFIYGLDESLFNWVVGFDSVQKDTSKIFVLSDKHNGVNIIVVIRSDEKIEFSTVNLISSVYDKNNLQSLINRTYNAGKEFYINPMQAHKVADLNIELPIEIINKVNETIRKNFKSLEINDDFGLGM